MRVIAFNGSPRKGGNTHTLLTTVLDELKGAGIETELYQLGARPIHGCRACYECFKRKDQRCSKDDDVLNECLEKMLAADGMLIGSPTYFSNVSTEVKALIDRAGLVSRANGDMFRRKVGAAVVAVRRSGAGHVFSSINYFFTIGQMIIPGSSYWNMGLGANRGDVAKDDEGLATMRTLGQNMAWLMKKLAD